MSKQIPFYGWTEVRAHVQSLIFSLKFQDRKCRQSVPVFTMHVLLSILVLLLAFLLGSCNLIVHETYAIRETGPAGGLVFFDKGYYKDGWRYLEAAPAATEWQNITWGGYMGFYWITDTQTGSGKTNTKHLVEAFGNAEPYQNLANYAAKLCDDLDYNGYSDWFLPSRDEAGLIKKELVDYNLGGFADPLKIPHYWTSSEINHVQAFEAMFAGSDDIMLYCAIHKDTPCNVRAIRAF